MLEKDLFDQFYETKDVALRNKLVEKHLYMMDIAPKIGRASCRERV